MIEIKNLSLQRGDKPLLEHADMHIAPRRRVGLIGRNGTGKSSLFALIRGEIAPDNGDVLLPKDWQIAAVAQETPALDVSALDYVLQGDAPLQTLRRELAAAERADDGVKIAELHAKLQEADAYTAEARAAKLLGGLGFAQAQHAWAVKRFSGGWRMRLNLAQALMCRADLLLLDEPTNHLDLEAVLWLEQHLADMPCTQIIISHDRDFLNAVSDYTVELSGRKLHGYGGNYDFYLKERAQRLAAQQSAYQKQQAHIKHLQSFIDRFKAKATKAAQAQSRVKALEKLEKLAPAHADSRFAFAFAAPEHLPNPLLKLDRADLGYNGDTVLHQVSLSLENGARYGLLGVNGSGKSTFIKALAGGLLPQNGEIVRADKLSVGYFAQHQLDVLRDEHSPVWHVRRISPDAKEQDVRNFLGGFDFCGDMAVQPVAPFSGGEKARLALALLVWQKPNLLLLDEPTNHLDLDMRHALTLALQSFQGALVLVSHDRSLIEAATDRFLLVHEGRVSVFDGDLNDYRKWRLARQQAEHAADWSAGGAPSSPAGSRKAEKRREAEVRAERARLRKPLERETAAIEAEMAQCEARKTAAEAFLADETAYLPENKTKLQQALNEAAQAKARLEALETAWLDVQTRLEAVLAG
ncbi:ATP-binding cassette domain-containing protein [Conchiformibius kuhniae]|uniref:Probable ATP-binding protein YheS n=1 Tax=Conchiformibius kuhniae TaxID=211502 RepID=A0A8T9MYW9_9NEIS|nr:ATP-binding cassette domain-containing protein [Conchiformibius kuhniae]UOP05003.1 ATP-binding cassette domain-containing protein [Conchiformibius kuhniae]